MAGVGCKMLETSKTIPSTDTHLTIFSPLEGAEGICQHVYMYVNGTKIEESVYRGGTHDRTEREL